MKSTKIESNLQSFLQKLLKEKPVFSKIVDQIAKNNGRAVLVGGAVRDLLLHELNPQQKLEIKDLDIEVHGLTFDELSSILKKYGPVSEVGKSFGVLRVHGVAIDWSLPRTDSSGRRPEVKIDPFMNIADAFRRRDLTINAMGIDLKTFELLDPFNGLQDLKAGILRAPDVTLFIEDPLRLFRVMQFIGRFEMNPDKELNKICSTMNLAGVSLERIETEFDKLILKSLRPSLGIRWLKDIARVQEILPELAATVGIEQELSWHPEGDVFEHTMQAIDAGAALSYTDDYEKLTALYALMCHDLGKVTTTKLIDGKLRSHGHEIAGVEPTKKLLKRITHRKELINAVVKLVVHHMAPVQFGQNGAKMPAYKRLALKLAPEVTIALLAKVALADKRGRNAQSHIPLTKDLPAIEQFLEKAQAAHVVYKPEEPVLLGRDLEGIIEPGPQMGALLKKAYEIQIEDGITDKQELLKKILK